MFDEAGTPAVASEIELTTAGIFIRKIPVCIGIFKDEKRMLVIQMISPPFMKRYGIGIIGIRVILRSIYLYSHLFCNPIQLILLLGHLLPGVLEASPLR